MKMNVKVISSISMLILLSGVFAAMIGDVSEGAEPTVITDGTGRTFEYTEPTERIVTMGYASTLTVAMLGQIGKIIAVDTYSTYEYTGDERLKNLDAANMGSIYTASNNDKIVAQFVQWVQEGKMSLDDTIILTTYANANVLRDSLMDPEIGFTKVLVYLSVTSYDQVVDFVRSMSVIVTGGVSPLADEMELVKTIIGEKLEGITEKAKGLGVWYSAASGFSVLNMASITASLIETAGGINVGYNPDMDPRWYGTAITVLQLAAANPDAVIFLSDTYIRNGHTVGDFRNDVLGGNSSIPIVVVNSTWNNYCPDAAVGLWAFACALYPDLFEGPAPFADDQPSDSSLVLYAAVGVLAAAMVMAAAFFIMKRP